MSRRIRQAGLFAGVALAFLFLLSAQPTQASPPAQRAAVARGQAAPTSHSGSFGGYVQPYFFPSFGRSGWFGAGFYTPFVNLPTIAPAYPYLPKYWWVSHYPIADPRQSGYNPASGYPRESATTLLLTTSPVRTRIILDGLYIGTSDFLGPIQLPVGEHTLRVEAAGYEPSETVLNIEEPVLQQLEVRLKPVASEAKSEPRQ